MSLEKDLQTIAGQESALQFTSFNAEVAWTLGSRLRDEALRLAKPMTFEIQVAGRLLFHAATEGAPASQADWIRRKRNTVLRFSKSSYAVGLQLQRDGQTLADPHGLSPADYAAHGGGFPIVFRGTGLVGTIIASGLPQREDHALVVQVLAELLNIEVETLAP